MTKTLVLMIILMLLGMSSIFAQSTFFEKGESGFGIYGGVQESFWEDGYFASIGYSYKGVVDIGVAYGNYKYDKDNFPEYLAVYKDPTEVAIIVGLDYWFLRTNTGKDRGIDVGLWTEYEMEDYKFYSEDTLETDATSSGFAFGPVFSINFDINDKWFIQPYFSIGYCFGNTEYKDSDKSDEDYKGGCSSIGVALARKFKCGNSIVFIFEIDSDSIEKTNDTAYEFSVGYNFGF